MGVTWGCEWVGCARWQNCKHESLCKRRGFLTRTRRVTFGVRRVADNTTKTHATRMIGTRHVTSTVTSTRAAGSGKNKNDKDAPRIQLIHRRERDVLGVHVHLID